MDISFSTGFDGQKMSLNRWIFLVNIWVFRFVFNIVFLVWLKIARSWILVDKQYWFHIQLISIFNSDSTRFFCWILVDAVAVSWSDQFIPSDQLIRLDRYDQKQGLLVKHSLLDCHNCHDCHEAIHNLVMTNSLRT